jgi:hypothetical protein
VVAKKCIVALAVQSCFVLAALSSAVAPHAFSNPEVGMLIRRTSKESVIDHRDETEMSDLRTRVARLRFRVLE